MFVYVASTAGVTPIGTDWDKAGSLIAVPGGVASIVIRPDGKTLYVTTDDTSTTVNTVIPVSTVTRKAGKPITFAPGAGSHPSPLVIMPNGKKVYVSAIWYGYHSNTVFSISTATTMILKEARPSDPRAIAFTPDGARAFLIDVAPGHAQGVVVSMTTVTDEYHPGFVVGEVPVAITIVP